MADAKTPAAPAPEVVPAVPPAAPVDPTTPVSVGSFGGIVEHLSCAADHCGHTATVKASLAPAESHVTRGSIVRDVLNGFLAKLGTNTAGVNFMVLAKVAILALQMWSQGKSVGEIVAAVVDAFLKGTL